MATANVFVFEVSTDEKAQAEIRELVAEMGMLPPGQSLRAHCCRRPRVTISTPPSRSAHLPLDVVDHEKPWLVSLQLLVAEGTAKHYSADAGVDHAVMAIAAKAHKPSAIFETIEQQLRLLAGSDDKLQIEEFASDLKDYQKDDDDLAPMVAAWSKGEADKLAALMNERIGRPAGCEEGLLTDRNRAGHCRSRPCCGKSGSSSSPSAPATWPAPTACRRCCARPDTKSRALKGPTDRKADKKSHGPAGQ